MSSANLNQQNLVVSITQNMYVPSEGPKSVPVLLDFTGSVTTYLLDMTLFQERGFMQMVQTLFLDLSNSTNDLIATIGGSGQQIYAKAKTQGYYTVLCPNPVKLQFDSAASGSVIPVALINVAVPGAVWPTA